MTPPASDQAASHGEIALHRDAFGRLVLVDAQGVEHVDVTPIRAFPLGDPRGGISICDDAGTELAWIERLDAAPAALREQLDAALAEIEFVPRITRIVALHAATEPSQWEVETDRGRTRFVVKSDDDVRRLDERQALVIDSHGIRYLIDDTKALDAYSRRMLERFL